MKSVIVTGGAGYVGSHTCKALSQAGFKVIVVDNLSTGHKKLVKWGPLEKGDIRDNKFLLKIFKKYKPIAVMHFAAKSQVAESVKLPEAYYDNNVNGTISLLKAMQKCRVQHIVFSSSCAIYGNPKTKKLKENHSKNPLNPYGETKLECEKLIKSFSEKNGVNYSSLRYFNAAGADLDGELGECHEPETHALPLIIEAALDKKKNFKVFGTDYETKDGTAIRDYIHVSDLAIGHVNSLELLMVKNKSHIVNLGTGKGTSVKELIEAVKKISKNEPNIIYTKRRKGDATELVADNSLAKKLLNFKCKSSKIEVIVKTAFTWHKNSNS